MSKTIIIELEFEHDDVDSAEIYNYLNELMENDCLDWKAAVKSVQPLGDWRMKDLLLGVLGAQVFLIATYTLVAFVWILWTSIFG